MTETNQTQPNPVVKALKSAASIKLTVICLLLLSILVVWGTVYQADNGLYQAQQKFFYSWFFLIFGVIPFPGTVLVMFTLFFNLVCSLYFNIGFKLRNIGNLITHTGIIILLVGGFFTFYYSEESSLMLQEGEVSNMSASRTMWETAVWEQTGGEADVYAIDANHFESGDTIPLDDLGFSLLVKAYHENCSAFRGQTGDAAVVNASGIRELKAKPLSMEQGENTAGTVLEVTAGTAVQTVLLYGRDSMPTPLTIDNRTYQFSLRKKKLPLGLTMKLMDFRVRHYPNSTIVKSYESTVSVQTDAGMDREVVISMNKPFRHANLTFFQSSYYIAPNGTEYSIFAVVKNSGRLLPYISSIIIFLGMVIHFIAMLLRRRKQAQLIAKVNHETKK